MLLPVPFSSPSPTLLFHGPLKPPSGIIASVDHADYSGYLSAVKALHLLPAPYKSISSKAFLCRSPGSFFPLMMNVLHFSSRRARQEFRCSVHILLLQCNVGGKTNEQQIWQNKSWTGLFKTGVMKNKEKKCFKTSIVSSLFIFIYNSAWKPVVWMGIFPVSGNTSFLTLRFSN